MRVVFLFFIAIVLIASCGGRPDKTKTEQSNEPRPSINDYDPHRGEGKFTEIDIPDEINMKLVEKGEKIFNVKCFACHRLTEDRLVGPGLKNVTDRRSAVWIMNFLTNTDEMIDLDPELQAQLEICLVRMPNQNLSDDDTRALYEFFRQNDDE